VIVGYALKPIAKGSPASINLNGMKDLMSGKKYTITGYPAMNPYLDKPSDDDVINSSESFHIFRTKPFSSPFRKYADRAITTTLITTGPGNSGGPVWTINAKGNWTASGVLTGGLPSETIVYGFTPDMNSLLRSVKPIVSSPQATSMNVGGVENTSHFFPYTKKHTIPDGVHKWTNFRASVNTFPLGKTINTLRLSLDIKTPHRGDLYVMLTSPQGVNTIIHNEQGADTKNLVIKDLNLSETFKDTPPNGTWTLRVQDRLKGDICVLRSFRLEIGTDLY
jgi:subtilisin-like proprotein convertase family protein